MGGGVESLTRALKGPLRLQKQGGGKKAERGGIHLHSPRCQEMKCSVGFFEPQITSERSSQRLKKKD